MREPRHRRHAAAIHSATIAAATATAMITSAWELIDRIVAWRSDDQK
jgi:hypothetical protein